jgi:hypothetical protein
VPLVVMGDGIQNHPFRAAARRDGGRLRDPATMV